MNEVEYLNAKLAEFLQRYKAADEDAQALARQAFNAGVYALGEINDWGPPSAAREVGSAEAEVERRPPDGSAV